MPANNNRVYYSNQAFGVAPFAGGSGGTYTAVRGVQQVSVNTRFNLEFFQELAQLDPYFQTETLPDVEVSVSRHLTGDCPVYLLGTSGAPAASLVGRANQRCNLALTAFDETQPLASGSANAVAQCTLSGMYHSQLGYDIQVGGPATESVTYVGNNKVWSTGTFPFAGFTAAHGVTSLGPAAPEGTNLRQHLIMASGLFPTNIPGITSSGTNPNVPGSGYAAHIQRFGVSVNLGRESMLELGRRAPYFRYPSFPADVTTTIDAMATQGDLVQATESGVYGNGTNSVAHRIRVVMTEGLQLDLGSQNLCQSVSHSGGDAGQGGNVTLSFQYLNKSHLDVRHPADPTVALRP